jgi:hypothetical protein
MPSENTPNALNSNLLLQLGKVCSHMKDVIMNAGGLLLTKDPFPRIVFHGLDKETELNVAATTEQWLEGAATEIIKYVLQELEDIELKQYFKTNDKRVLKDTFITDKYDASLSLIPTNDNSKTIASILLQIILWSCISEKCNHTIVMALNGFDKKNTFKQKGTSSKTDQEKWCYGMSISIKCAVYYSCRLNANGRLNNLDKKKKKQRNGKQKLPPDILKHSTTHSLLPALFMENIITQSAYFFGILGKNAVPLDCFTKDPKYEVIMQSVRKKFNVKQDSDLHTTNVAAMAYVNHSQSVLSRRLLSYLELQRQVKKPKVPTKEQHGIVNCDILSFFIASNKETREAIRALTAGCTDKQHVTIHSNLINTGSPASSHSNGIDLEEISTPIVPATNDNSNQIKNKLNELIKLLPKFQHGKDFTVFEKIVNDFVAGVLGKAAANDTEKQIPIRMNILILCAKDLGEKEESEWPEVLGNFFVDALNKFMEKKATNF